MHLLIALVAVTTLAQEPAPVSPEQLAAEKILTGMSEFYAGLKSVKADVQVTLEMKGPQRKNSMRATYSLAVRRPNQLALILRSSEVDGKPAYDGKRLLQEDQAYALDLICDGKDVYYYFSPGIRRDVQDAQKRSPDNPGPFRYRVSRFKAPAELDELDGGKIRTEWQLGLIHHNVLGLVQKRSTKNLAEYRKMGPLRDTGIEVVHEVKCHHVTLQSSLDLPQGNGKSTHVQHWWIEDGPRKRLLKESLDDQFGEITVAETTTYTNWVLDGPLTDADFALPPGVEEFPAKK